MIDIHTVKREYFCLGIMVGVLLSTIILVVPLVIIERNEWRDEIVKRNYGEYYIDKNNEQHFRWIEMNKCNHMIDLDKNII